MSPTPTPTESQRPKEKDYTVRKKIIWKGKMAPNKHLYLVVQVKEKHRKATAVRIIKGGQTDEVVEQLALYMREQIRESNGM